MTKVFINETLNDNVTVLPSEQGSIITITSSGAPGVTDHAALSNLGYAAAGHTGFEPSLPTMVGASLKFLQVNLAENAKQWTTVTMTPAGADTQVQFNNAGAFGANANFTFLSATERFGVGVAVPLATGHFKRAVGYAEVRVEVTAAGAGALLTAKNDTNSGWYTGIFTSVLGGAPVFFGLANAGGCFHTTWGGGETWVAMGPQTAIPLILGTNNVERMRFLPSGGTNRNLAEFNYIAAAPGADAIGDWNYRVGTGLEFNYCTVANAAKGGGTWNTMLGMAANVVTYKTGQVWNGSLTSTAALTFNNAAATELLKLDTTNGIVYCDVIPIYQGKLKSVNNFYIGTLAPNTVAGAYENISYGANCLSAITTGAANIGIGKDCGKFLTTGAVNIFIGSDCGANTGTADLYNVAIGYRCLFNAAGSKNRNTCVGNFSLMSLTTGGNNTAMGLYSLIGLTSGSNNIALGFYSGIGSTTQSYELFINSIDRVNRAGDIALSIIYGVQAATTAAQFLYLNTNILISNRLNEKKGIDVASANDLTLGMDGNVFVITGNIQINAITVANWQAGSKVTLVFTGTPTVKHNTVGGGGTAVMLLAGSIDLVAAVNTVLGLTYDGTQWQETYRKIA